MAVPKKDEDGDVQPICRNKRAFHEYEVFDTLECGLVLTGTEVKSLRDGAGSLEDAYAKIDDGELWLIGSDIPEYAMGNRLNHKPKRLRKLLLHRRELAKFAGKASQQGFTLVPLRMYFKEGRAKVEIAIARGKKLYDKREVKKTQEVKKNLRREMKNRREFRRLRLSGTVTEDRPMRITALVKGTEHVCCRYRVAAFQQRLKRAGHPLDLRGWPESWLERWELYRHLKQTDALFVQRKLLPPWQLKLVRRRVSRLIFDYDDSIFLRNSYNPLGHDSPRRSQRFEEMIRSADAVIAGNAFLAEQARAVADPARIHVIPTCVDVARYPLARHSPDKKLVEMAWVGSSSTIQGLEKIAPILELLGKTLPGLQLKVICDRSLPLEHLSVDFCPWDEATEAAELAAADIGISWLPDDLWSRGKCGLKVLQYMAAGLPVVANPVGMQVDLVRPGETGFLADTPEEWLHAVHLLVSDPELRRKMGWAARRRVEAEFSVAAGSTAWLRVLDGLEQASVPRASA